MQIIDYINLKNLIIGFSVSKIDIKGYRKKYMQISWNFDDIIKTNIKIVIKRWSLLQLEKENLRTTKSF